MAHRPGSRRVSYAEAASLLNKSVDTVRAMVRRKELEYEQEGNRHWVMLPEEMVSDSDPRTELIVELRDRVTFLQTELDTCHREKGRLLDVMEAVASSRS